MSQEFQPSAVDRTQACLQKIAACEADVQSWQYLDSNGALQQATAVDESIAQGRAGVLAGMPVAVKDIFATADMPTGWGTPIHQGDRLGYDAAIVERLRSAGAIILGKTVTTEYATARAGKTRNPHNFKHTPGGSSSGSAAAVAAEMASVAIGSQTLGSIVRPAAYCGVLGFKPSFGSISRYGAMPVSRDLDHVGLFAASLDDLVRVCHVLAIADTRDPDCCSGSFPLEWKQERARERELERSPPRLALVRSPYWDEMESEAQQHFLGQVNAIEGAGAAIDEVTLPAEFADAFDHARRLMSVGLAVHHGGDYDAHSDQLSPKLRELIEQGRGVSGLDYGRSRQAIVHYSITLAAILSQYDAILTPAATGPAPAGLENTGSPIFCVIWTVCGLPAISIPAGRAANGLPLAIQLVGRRMNDVELLRVADWLISAGNCLA